MHYPVQLDITVAWGDMDAFGHVNNVMYFRYFESVRIEYFRRLEGDFSGNGDFVPILAGTSCSYLRPVYFPDTLRAEARVTRMGRSSVTMAYRLTSTKENQIVAEGEAVVVNIDPATGKGRPLSEGTRAQIAAIEGGGLE